MIKKYSIIIVMLFVLALFIGCAGSSSVQQTDQVPMYTAYNLWHDRSKVYCINYQRGKMLPAGTKVEILEVVSRGEGNEGPTGGTSVPHISFRVFDSGEVFTVNYRGRYHPRRSVKDFARLMFTDKPFDELTEGMTEKEIAAIKHGVIVKGMSKKAVVVSAGLPPTHRTYGMKSSTWYFWKNRRESKKICFDANNLAARCPQVKRLTDLL